MMRNISIVLDPSTCLCKNPNSHSSYTITPSSSPPYEICLSINKLNIDIALTINSSILRSEYCVVCDVG